MFNKTKILRKEDLDYFLGLKKFIFWITGIFIATIILGFLLIKSDPQSSESVLEILRTLAEKTSGLKNYELLILIFLNNGLKILIVAFLGLIFGIVPIFFIALNGLLIGMVAFIIQENHSWGIFWSGILPHGIFEVPALIVGGAVGLKLGNFFVKRIKKTVDLKDEFKKAFLFLFRVLLPVLLFASFIEVFVSQAIINMLK